MDQQNNNAGPAETLLVTKREVNITIDGTEYKIPQGTYTVAEIKRIGHVPAAYELEEKIHGKLTPLADDGSVNIKGEEVFIGHPRDSSSS